MSTEFKYNDYSVKVKSAIAQLATKTLDEVGGELKSQVTRNTTVGKVNGGQLKSSWDYQVTSSDDEHTVVVGSPLERALWVEFGTGDYAIPNPEGKGSRKGGWFIPIGSGEGEISEAVVKAYGFRIYHGKNGKEYVHTNGLKPRRPLFNAYKSSKNKLIRRIQNAFKGGLS